MRALLIIAALAFGTETDEIQIETLLDHSLSSDWINPSIEGQLNEFCSRERIACSVEEAAVDPIDSQKGKGVGIELATYRDLIRRNVAGHPSYSWFVTDNILTVRPKKGHEYRKGAIAALDTKVDIMGISKLSQPARARLLVKRAGLGYGRTDEFPSETTLESKNATKVPLRNALNSILKTCKDGGMWTYTKRGNSSFEVDLRCWPQRKTEK